MRLEANSEKMDQISCTLPRHRVFFIAFLFSLPFSIRKVLAIVSPDGTFNEYLDVSVYLSDILLAVTLVIYILENKRDLMSREHWKRMFHVEHLLPPISVPFFFITWSGLSILWSESTLLAFSSWIKLTEGYILYLYILISNVPRGTFGSDSNKCSTWNIWKMIRKMFHVEQVNSKNIDVPRGTIRMFRDNITRWRAKCSTWNIYQSIFTVIIISAIFQSFFGILQFLSQKSLGLSILKESDLSIYAPGIAKVVINGDVFIRAYGFFPHPNVLGGFIAVSLLMTIAYPFIFTHRMFHVEHLENDQDNVPRGTFSYCLYQFLIKCSTWNIFKLSDDKMFHVEHHSIKWLYRVLILIQLLALSFTFSKSATFGFIIGLIVFIYGMRRMFHVEQINIEVQNVSRGTFGSDSNECSTWNIWKMIRKMFHVEQVNSKNIDVPRGTIRMFRDNITRWRTKCSTWNIFIGRLNMFKKMFHVEHFIVIVGAILFGYSILAFNLRLFLVQPATERLFYLQSISGLSEAYFFQGLGIGQFVFVMQQFFTETLLPWQLQPIHNVFLLIFSEVGLVGFGLFLWFFIYIYYNNYYNVPRGTFGFVTKKCSTWNIMSRIGRMFHVEHCSGNPSTTYRTFEKSYITSYLIYSIIIMITGIMLLDHYFWDIQQGQLLLWIIFALSVSRNKN